MTGFTTKVGFPTLGLLFWISIRVCGAYISIAGNGLNCGFVGDVSGFLATGCV